MNGLSKKAASLVDWNRLNDLTAGELAKRGSETPTPDLDRIRIVFGTAKSEFTEAGKTLRHMMNLFLGLVGVSIVIAISGLVLAAATGAVITGTALSGVSVATMMGLFSQVHRYGRDQALFQFLVSKYELVLSLSPPEQFPSLLDSFLKEIKVLRGSNEP